VNKRVPLPAADTTAARARLDERRHQLEQMVAAEHAMADSTHDVTDRKDEAHDELQAAIASADMRRHLAELREIRLAHERITEGSYGECVSCGLPIAPGRLQAQPTAMRCTMCQSALERHSQF
jgi:DnaK suppressor protein